ncbi:MAG: gamma-glutamyl-gamma-aminobutyrate hydrolase family protein [Clostridia bacterium]|nr:gamma-glutamyl-gamma-aminobutyrate hydrolase family protein [Clostridia bacterium]
MFKFNVEISLLGDNYLKALNRADIGAVTNAKEPLDGLILTGGGDVAPCLYGERCTHASDIDLMRDQKEFLLIKKYLRENKPILGICRGLQVINVFFGGTLYQHVPCHSQVNNKDTYHKVFTRKNTFMGTLFGDTLSVNSAHHQAINTLGKGLRVSAIAPDNVIEAVEAKNLIATQFHPERYPEIGIKIFEYFYTLLSAND